MSNEHPVPDFVELIETMTALRDFIESSGQSSDEFIAAARMLSRSMVELDQTLSEIAASHHGRPAHMRPGLKLVMGGKINDGG